MILEVRGLTVSYGEVVAVRDAQLQVKTGEALGLIGPNGSGKTSVLKAIIGLVEPSHGQIVFQGTTINGMPTHERVRMGVVYCPERAKVVGELTVTENLKIGAYVRKDLDEVQKDLRDVFSLFPVLEKRMHQPAWTLSGGERQMLVIGRALLGRPRLLMLDEPFLGLAPDVKENLLEALKRVQSTGVTVMIAEHDLEATMKFADTLYAMKGGEGVFHGGVDAFLSQGLADSIFS